MNVTIPRRPRSVLAAFAALLLSGTAFADSADNGLDPVYLAGSQYTAVLQPQLQRWTLSPQTGPDLEIRSIAPCPHQTVPGKGLWLIGRDAEGNLELIAPSATALPAGHSGRVALRSCETAGEPAGSPGYGVPGQVLELLAAHSGAVLVDG